MSSLGAFQCKQQHKRERDNTEVTVWRRRREHSSSACFAPLSCSAARGVCSLNINVNSGQPRLNSQPTPIMVPQHTEAGCIWGRHSTERAPTHHPTSNTVFPPSAMKSSTEKKKKKNPPPPWKLYDWVGCTLNGCVCVRCSVFMHVCTWCTNLTRESMCVSIGCVLVLPLHVPVWVWVLVLVSLWGPVLVSDLQQEDILGYQDIHGEWGQFLKKRKYFFYTVGTLCKNCYLFGWSVLLYSEDMWLF